MKKILIILPLVLFFSCTEPQPSIITLECSLINRSGVDLSMVLYQSTNDTIAIANNQETIKEIEVEDGFDTPFFYCDSIAIIFSSGKKISYKWQNTSARNPLMMESYTITKINEFHYKYKYIFTEQDYLNISN